MAELSKRLRRSPSKVPWAVVLATGRAVRLRRWSRLVDAFSEAQPVLGYRASDDAIDPAKEILKKCRDARWH